MSDSATQSETGELKAKDTESELADVDARPETAVVEKAADTGKLQEEQVERHALIETGARVRPRDGSAPRLFAARRCDLGAVRDRNEDYCLIFVSEAGGHFSLAPFGLFIVADGMGGHTNGHVASNLAARVAARHVLDNIYLPMLHNPNTAKQAPIQEVLANAVQAANTAVFQEDPQSDSGTTLTVALLLQRRLYVAHVGDSRLYLKKGEKLEVVTEDHSLVQRLKDVGSLTNEQAAVYRYKNVLLRAVGQAEDVEIDTYMRLLPKQGQLLLCSDGLCGMVTDEAIQEVMDRGLPVQETANALYDVAMEAGGYDNITAVVVNFEL